MNSNNARLARLKVKFMVHSANWSESSATSEKGQNMVKVSFKDSFAARIIAGVSRKTWAVCGAALLTCFIIFCFYGFLIALGIVVTIALCKNLNETQKCYFCVILSQSHVIECPLKPNFSDIDFPRRLLSDTG